MLSQHFTDLCVISPKDCNARHFKICGNSCLHLEAIIKVNRTIHMHTCGLIHTYTWPHTQRSMQGHTNDDTNVTTQPLLTCAFLQLVELSPLLTYNMLFHAMDKIFIWILTCFTLANRRVFWRGMWMSVLSPHIYLWLKPEFFLIMLTALAILCV